MTENFTLKWSSQRIYMMDYERTMNQLFSGSRELFSGKRILLGISDGEGMYAKKSENGRYTVFVTNRELWAYDREEGRQPSAFLPSEAGTRMTSGPSRTATGWRSWKCPTGGLWISWSTAI